VMARASMLGRRSEPLTAEEVVAIG
jgi:hypothetical protein